MEVICNRIQDSLYEFSYKKQVNLRKLFDYIHLESIHIIVIITITLDSTLLYHWSICNELLNHSGSLLHFIQVYLWYLFEVSLMSIKNELHCIHQVIVTHG